MSKKQRNATQPIKNPEKIDLFVVLDISGSMSSTCNKLVNHGAGYYVTAALASTAFVMSGGTFAPLLLAGGITGIGGGLTQKINSNATTRLEEAKTHLTIQIKELIKQGRINRLGLITFNDKAKVSCGLTDNYDMIIDQILRQRASGLTALYDSLNFAAKELEVSKNPRVLIMTDGQDNSSKSKDMEWAKRWFLRDGLKSTFFTICEGHTQRNMELAKELKSKYTQIGEQCWFSNSFDDKQLVNGMEHLI